MTVILISFDSNFNGELASRLAHGWKLISTVKNEYNEYTAYLNKDTIDRCCDTCAFLKRPGYADYGLCRYVTDYHHGKGEKPIYNQNHRVCGFYQLGVSLCRTLRC